MKKRVEITDAAQAELDEAIDWYMQQEPRAVTGFIEEYVQSLLTVGKYAPSIAAYMLGTKRQLFASYPY